LLSGPTSSINLLIDEVRFGSKTGICDVKSDVCFTPDSDRESGHLPMVMYALPPKADMRSATKHVRLRAKSGHHQFYSITSSTMEARPGGIVNPSARAV